MKTTIELPDALLRQAKLYAVKKQITLKQLITNALKRIIAETPETRQVGPEWMKCFGAFKDSVQETKKIQKTIDTEFSSVNPDDWK